MENGGRLITGVKLYECGRCKNNLGHMFKNHKSEVRMFPALVVLIQHSKFGNILYDSGYSDLIYKNHVVSFLYNAINRTYLKDSETIVSRLSEDSVAPDSVHKIILSHAHPDHIGGLRFFQGYDLISTEKVIDTMKKGSAFQLVFRNMVPDGGVHYEFVKPYEGESVLDGYFEKIYDVLGDGSILGVELSGHADGQLGIYLPEYKILFAADACWGTDLLGKVKDMRFVAKLIQNNYGEYVNTAEKLEHFSAEHPDIKVIYTHDEAEKRHYE